MNGSITLQPAAASRHANPFATCWTRPGAIAFRFPVGQCREELLSKLAAQGWWGAILGPHGSGKTTLLESLKPALRDAGWHIRAISLRAPCATACGGSLTADAGPRTARPKTIADVMRQAVLSLNAIRAQLPRAVAHNAQLPRGRRGDAHAVAYTDRRTMLIIDGYEQLGWLQRARLTRRCRRAGCGLLVTAHAPTNVPTLIHLAPNKRLIQQLVADLIAGVSTPVTPADVSASYARHGSNVRDILFDLYDRHEQRRRMLT